MIALSSNNPTLLDLAKATDPDGNIADIVEILMEENEILRDMGWVTGNLPTGTRTTIRTGIPEPTWRKIYGFVQPNKSTTVQVDEKCGSLWAYAEVDCELADLNGNAPAWRLQEDKAHIQGMNNEMAESLFFANETTEPEAFTGLAPRFNDLGAENGDNIIDGGGTGSDNRSIWLVVWGPNTVHGLVPKGSTAGLRMEDKGKVTIQGTSGADEGGRMEAYRSLYRWSAGLSVRDWRFVVRIANIDKSNLNKDASSSSADLPDLMFRALDLVPNLTAGRAAFYMSRDVRTFLRRQLASAVGNSTLRIENVGGVMTHFFQEVPLRRCDVLSADEARVV